MLNNFFSLNGTPNEIINKVDLMNVIMAEDEIIDILYRPDILKPKKDHPRIKIERKSFTNVSFSKTILKNIDFTSCHFEDCLLIGTTFDNCKFRQCTFKNVNTHEINIKKTYINPESFIDNFEKKDIKKSNIAVHLFQQLLNNSRDEEQSDFARISNYYFKTWQGRLSRSKFHHKKTLSNNSNRILYRIYSKLF